MESFEKQPNTAVPGPSAESETSQKPEAVVESKLELSDEQIGVIVDRILKILEKRRGGNEENSLANQEAEMEMSRDDVFYRKLDQIVLNKIDRISRGEGNARLDKKLDDAYKGTDKYREDLATGRFEKK